MAKNITDISNNFWLVISESNKHFLGGIRHWENIKIAVQNGTIYLKEITAHQIKDTVIQQIPSKAIYYEKENLLFPQNQIVPSKRVPIGLLWSPIAKLLAVQLPKENFNFFGINEKIPLEIVSVDKEYPANAIVTTIEQANEYILNAPEMRLSALEWTILQGKILIIGTPLLPIKGNAYWQYQNHLIPCGYHFNHPQLAQYFYQKNKWQKELIVWQKDSGYIVVNKDLIKPLSISSFRLTLNKLK